MTPIFTTSWDDGHPLDLRVADLLEKYGLPGTFYVPARAPGPVLGAAAVRELSANFEIGAHTMTHADLPALPDLRAFGEIVDSKRFVEDLTGRDCRTFAPPGGSFRHVHVVQAAAAGFCGFRTVELMSLGRPIPRAGLAVMPTTLQVFPHAWTSYARNAMKRWRPGNVATFLAHARGADLPRATESLVAAAIERGGVFHLWGHSWEIEAAGMWPALERMLATMQALGARCRRATNREICEEVLRDESIAKTVAAAELS